MSDDELVQHALGGDVLAFGSLVARHQSRVRGFLLRMTRGDHAAADDLAQETFLEAYRKLKQFKNRGSFSGWLFAIAYSRFLMAARQRAFEPLDNAGEQATPPVDNDAKLDLERGLARLGPAERAVLTLCGALGYSHTEAAGILDMPLGTVKSHALRGRERLRAFLSGEKEMP